MVQIYKKILRGEGNREKRKRKTATNHHNKQQQLAPPPYPSPKGRGVKCNESNWPHPPTPPP